MANSNRAAGKAVRPAPRTIRGVSAFSEAQERKLQADQAKDQIQLPVIVENPDGSIEILCCPTALPRARSLKAVRRKP